MLTDLITRYFEAKAAWELKFEEDQVNAGSCPEWDAYVDAGDKVISYHCTGEALRRKAEVLLSDDYLFDTLENTTGSTPLRRFLASLCGPTGVLSQKIEDHRRTLKAWKNTAGPDQDLECEGSPYDNFVTAEYQFIVHPCRSQEEIQQKLAYVSDCREMAESIHGDRDSDGTYYQSLFLNSLRLATPVEKSNNGGN